MDDFLKYFENEKFVDWIHHPDQELNDYWDNWFREHPEDKKEAQYARLIMMQLRSSHDKAKPDEVIPLFSRIEKKISQPKPKSKNNLFRLLGVPMRYAAVALILLSFGVFLTYQIRQKKMGEVSSVTALQENSDVQLILSDGRKIPLNSKEAHIEYNAGGKIVINQKDTIESPTQSAEAEMNQLIIPYGKNSSVQLSDGTMAYLNAGSRLTYPTVFSGNTREVVLEGEGYFEVAHHPEKPFIVKMNGLSVTALGTIFNISAYLSDQSIETVLVEGKVVLREDSSNGPQKDFILSPNDLADFNRETHLTTSRQVDAGKYVSWHQGILEFQSTDLSRVIQKVERYYNIKVNLDNQALGTRSITGKLMLKDNREGVLEVLASTARVELVRIDDKVYRFE